MTTIYNNDALTQLKLLESESIDLVVTSPPYYCTRDYEVEGQIGLEKTPQEYISKLLDIFRECKRVLKKTGSLWVNIADSYSDKNKSLVGVPERFVLAMTDELGLIRRNTIIWKKPNCMPSSIKDRFTIDFEYFYFFTKSKKYYFDTQYEPYKVDSLRRINKFTKLKDKTHININSNGRIKRTVWEIRPQTIKEKHFATFPEKLIETPILACCPSQVCTKCNKPREKIIEWSGEYHIFGNPNKTKKYTKCKMTRYYNSLETSGTLNNRTKKYQEVGLTDCGCNVPFQAGTVLDPFMGTGTTGVVAKKLERNFIGIELNKEYIKIAENRIQNG